MLCHNTIDWHQHHPSGQKAQNLTREDKLAAQKQFEWEGMSEV